LFLLGDFLRPQMLLHGQGEVGAALHRRIVGDDHDLAARDPADAADHARARRAVGVLRIAVHAVGGQLADLEEGRAGIQQAVDAVAGQQLAARDVAVAAGVGPAARGLGHLGVEFVAERPVMGVQRLESL
jgi:hypothetical protein